VQHEFPGLDTFLAEGRESFCDRLVLLCFGDDEREDASLVPPGGEHPGIGLDNIGQ
jgi:hypothetical protein